MKTNKNDGAFARPSTTYEQAQPGITKLEYFAAAALQGLLANSSINWVSEDKVVRSALVCAKMLIDKLNEQEGVSDENK